jgi:hypothetical protein
MGMRAEQDKLAAERNWHAVYPSLKLVGFDGAQHAYLPARHSPRKWTYLPLEPYYQTGVYLTRKGKKLFAQI